MKYSEFRRMLERLGAKFTPGRGSHYKASLNGRTTIFPDHGQRKSAKDWWKRSRRIWA